MKLNEKQLSTLRSIHFWRRNQMIAKRDGDQQEYNKSHESIKFQLEIADKQEIPFKIQNKVLSHAEEKRTESFSDIDFSDKDKHKLRITSLENVEEVLDADEVAKVVLVNGVTNKEHSFSVWASDMENNELSPYYIYFNNPQELPDDYSNIKDALLDSSMDFTLSDLVKDSSEIEKNIQDYVLNEDKEFSFEIPPSQQGFDLHSLIVDEEVADLLIKNEMSMVTKQDLIDFGKLVEDDKDFSFNFDYELNESFQTIINQSGVKKDEIKYLNTAFNALNVNLDASNFSKNNIVEKENEQEITI